jgi:hypothetical protein
MTLAMALKEGTGAENFLEKFRHPVVKHNA